MRMRIDFDTFKKLLYSTRDRDTPVVTIMIVRFQMQR